MMQAELHIGDKVVGPGHPPYVIAEAGSNFNQSLDTAYRLIDAAAEAGADAVKFQLFKAEALYPGGGKIFDLFKSIELNAEWIPKLSRHAGDRRLHFLASAFDMASITALVEADVPAFKVASSEASNTALLHTIAKHGKPVIIATGMCDMVDIEEAVAVCLGAGNSSVALLQCGAMYPLPPELANLRVMASLAARFQCPIGFSDHTLGINTAIAAIGAGAQIIEKHFTLSRESEGPDHFYALEPGELAQMVKGIRESFAALGNGVKDLLPEERRLGRRDGLYASRDLPAGAIFSREDIDVMRPAVGLRARYRDSVIGARARSAIAKGQPLTWDDVSF